MKTPILFAMAAAISAAASAVPAAIIDLTTAGASGHDSYGAYFRQIDSRSTGSGNIRPFVRISGNSDITQGYNTDGRPVEFDENNSQQYTHSLPVADIPTERIGGQDYLQFLLDINQFNSSPLLSLSKLEIYVADAPDIRSYATLVATADPVYSMAGTVIKLNYSLNTGSGSGDMLADIPMSCLTSAKPYLYLYSEFGRPIAGDPDIVSDNDGYEEWAIITAPEPASAALVLVGMATMSLRRSRRA